MFGKVLITGAGGSIGSALARSIVASELVLYDHSEYALYEVSEALQGTAVAALGNCRDRKRLREFADGVDTVFHCAAYKHVPMAEGINADEVHRNNVAGTLAVLETFKKARRVVLLSTDKAVKPRGVMGRSKAACERWALHYGRTVARLGNILESSGSVVPKFRRQIAAGGPVTVTHPEASRYFIPMERAVAFLIDCAGRPPGAYTVPMGDPVRIADLAREMIGSLPVEIVYTGLRPGEKLHEDLPEDAIEEAQAA